MTLPKEMLALQLRCLGRLEKSSIRRPQPGPREVLIRTAATTICSSDLSDIAENPFGVQLPTVPGHEAAGVIAAVGSQVEGFVVGQRVTAHPVIPCGQCADCHRGLAHLCSQMGHLGLDRNGTFAEFFCIPATRIRAVPAGMDLATAALMEPVCVCIEAVERARVTQGDTVVIAGDGPFGLLTARLVLGRQPRKLILLGHHDFRMNQVPQAVPVHGRRTENVLQTIMAETDGLGVDAAVLCVASQSALDNCVASLRARGRLVIFSPLVGRPTVNLFRLLIKELEILGACNDEDYLDRALELLADDQLGLGNLVTHRIPFQQWERAFELAAHGKLEAIKVALVFGETV